MTGVQTCALPIFKDFLKYQKHIPAKNDPKDNVLARFTASDEKVHMSGMVPKSKKCTDRMWWGVRHRAEAATQGIVLKSATGIDCFGELIMHEWQHRKEYFMWKGMDDRDQDGVPYDIEKKHPGCVDTDVSLFDLALKSDELKKSWYSCDERPFNEATDRELFAYYVGWHWMPGKADKEDWSQCGKQWTDKCK